jgi:sugar/nucleoside kinase (ribokinase family)
MSLAVFGSVGLDDVETPAGAVKEVVGGSAVYFSLAASLFTGVRLAANVGGDFPDGAWEVLRGRGADLSGLQVFPDKPTFRWSGRYEGDMNEAETLKTELNVLIEEPVVPPSFKDARIVFLANMGPDTQLKLIEQFADAVVFADTMNLWIDIQRPALEKLLSLVYGFICNDAEARMLTGEHNLIAAGQALQAMGPDIVIIKKGEHGSFLFSPDGRFGLPAFPTEAVVDPTGAGDSFAGGFLGSLAEHDSWSMAELRRSMVYGTVCASMTVEAFSTAGLDGATREELDARFTALRDFVSF